MCALYCLQTSPNWIIILIMNHVQVSAMTFVHFGPAWNIHVLSFVTVVLYSSSSSFVHVNNSLSGI